MKKTRFEDFCDCIKEEVSPLPYNDHPGKPDPEQAQGLLVVRTETEGMPEEHRDGGECDFDELISKVLSLGEEERRHICDALMASFESGEEEMPEGEGEEEAGLSSEGTEDQEGVL